MKIGNFEVVFDQEFTPPHNGRSKCSPRYYETKYCACGCGEQILPRLEANGRLESNQRFNKRKYINRKHAGMVNAGSTSGFNKKKPSFIQSFKALQREPIDYFLYPGLRPKFTL